MLAEQACTGKPRPPPGGAMVTDRSGRSVTPLRCRLGHTTGRDVGNGYARHDVPAVVRVSSLGNVGIAARFAATRTAGSGPPASGVRPERPALSRSG